MELEYQEAREYIILHGRELLERDKNGKGYVCPCCGSGSGRHGTGMREDRDKPGYFKCWAGGSDDCPNHDNIISIFQKAYHLSNKDAFKECCKRFSIELVHQRDKDQPIPQAVKDLEKIKAKAHAAQASAPPVLSPAEIAAEIAEAQKHIGETDYLTKRGLSPETQKAFGCGYIGNWYNPSVREKIQAGEWHFRGTPRVIIPTSQTSYLARATVPDEELAYTNPKMKVGRGHQFNWQIVHDAKEPVVVVEGEIDAMSVYEAGYKTVAALGSTNFLHSFMEYAAKEGNKDGLSFVCVMDNDKAGREAQKEFFDACDAHGFQVASGTSMLLENTKDANDSLLKDREAFSQRIQKTVQDAKNAIQANAYRQRFRAIYAAGSIETPKNGEETFLKWMSTGMANRREGYIPYALRQAKNAGWTGEQMELALMRYAPQTVYRGRSYAKELVSGICVKPQFEREK